MLHDYHYGRKDATSETQCGASTPLPTADNFVSVMKAKGFTDSELVALANI